MMLAQNLVVDARLQILVQNHTFVVVVVVLLPFLYLRILQIFYMQKLTSKM